MENSLLDTYSIPKQIPTTALLAVAPFVIVAPIVGSVVGLVIGGAVGGLVGVLVGLGIAENRADRQQAETDRLKEPLDPGPDDIRFRRERPPTVMADENGLS